MRTSRGWWALSGIVAGALGLAMSYAAAALLHVRESPVVAVAEGVTALTPGAVVKWAINTFDRDDKKVLVVGILVLLTLVFALLGRVARRQWWLAVAGYVVLAGIAFLAVASKPTPALIDYVPVVVGLLCWVTVLAVLAEVLRRWEVEGGQGPEAAHTRRQFLVAVGGAAAMAAAAGLVGRIAGSARRRAEESRRLLRIEGVTAPAVPDGVELVAEGVTPWETPSEDFYLIDTAFIKPTIEPTEWSKIGRAHV